MEVQRDVKVAVLSLHLSHFQFNFIRIYFVYQQNILLSVNQRMSKMEAVLEAIRIEAVRTDGLVYF